MNPPMVGLDARCAYIYSWKVVYPIGFVMMIPRLPCLALAVLAAMSLLDSASAASSAAMAAEQQWAVMDRCTRLAITKFPDHTTDALAKRDDFTRRCQREARVPVRDGLAPK